MKFQNIFAGVWNDGKPFAIDYMVDGKGIHSGSTLEETLKKYPSARLMTTFEFVAWQDSFNIAPPVMISEEEFHEAFEILPPLDFKSNDGGMSFKMSEFIVGNITRIYATLNGNFFKMQNIATLAHSDILDLCLAVDGEKKMKQYLIHYHGHGEVRNINNATTSSDKWDGILREFAKKHGGNDDDYADAISLYSDCVTPNGISYDWHLAGPDGASFQLHHWPETSPEEINTAKDFLKRTQDVVRLTVLKLTQC